MGAALEAYVDFVTSTGNVHLNKPGDIVNDASLRNYEGFNIFGRSKRALQGGNQIKTSILLSDPATASTYKPGDAATIVNNQNLSQATANWRFFRDYMTFVEAELLLNEGGGGDAMFQQFVNLRDSKWQATTTSMFNEIARLLVATPANSTMEASSGEKPFSYRTFATSDGLAPSGFTTVMGINPTSESNWRNQNTTYDKDAMFDPDTGLIAGFTAMKNLIRFQQPSVNVDGSKFTDSDLKNCVVLTNKEGLNDYIKVLRASNDFTRVGTQDPDYPEPVYWGVTIQADEALDDQSVFSAGSPDFFFINGNYMELVFHSKKWFQKTKELRNANQPDSAVVWVDTYWNLVCRSRRRQGYLQGS